MRLLRTPYPSGWRTRGRATRRQLLPSQELVVLLPVAFASGCAVNHYARVGESPQLIPSWLVGGNPITIARG